MKYLKNKHLIGLLSCFLFASIASAENVQLSLKEFIDEVLIYNPLIEEACIKWKISEKGLRATLGEFEPVLTISYKQNELERENSIAEKIEQGGLDEYFEDNEEYSVGINGLLTSATTYRIGFNVQELKNNLDLDEDNTEIIPEYKSFFGINLEQPLLRNATFGAPLIKRKIAKKEKKVALQNLRKQVMNIVSKAEIAYWNLVFAKELSNMSAESYDIALKVLEDCKERVEVGKMSELDYMEAETALSLRLSQKEEADIRLSEARKDLKLFLINKDLSDDEVIIPSEDIVHNKNKDYNDYLENYSINNQPDFAIYKQKFEIESMLLSYTRDQLLPELNLTGSYGYNSLGDSEDNAIDKLEDKDHPSWSVGVEMKVPLFLGIKERNEFKAAKLKKTVALKKMQAIEKEIKYSLKSLADKIKAYGKQIESTKKVKEFRKKLLDAEISHLEQGKSNSRLVFNAEEELAKAKRKELEMMVKYRETILSFERLSGMILINRELEFIKDQETRISEIITKEDVGNNYLQIVSDKISNFFKSIKTFIVK